MAQMRMKLFDRKRAFADALQVVLDTELLDDREIVEQGISQGISVTHVMDGGVVSDKVFTSGKDVGIDVPAVADKDGNKNNVSVADKSVPVADKDSTSAASDNALRLRAPDKNALHTADNGLHTRHGSILRYSREEALLALVESRG